MYTRSGTLKAVEPFDFGRSMEFLQRFGPMQGEQYVGEGAITKALIIGGGRGGRGEVAVFRVRSGRTPSELNYELFSAERMLDDVTAERAARKISFFLSLDDDVGQFYAIAEEKDKVYYPKVRELWGLHHVKFPSLLEIACWAIINQRIQRSAALRMKRAIVERYGEKMELGDVGNSAAGRTYWAFPDYERLRVATPRELLALTKNQRVAQRLDSLIQRFDELDEDFLRNALIEKAEERLKRIKGIGDWSAQFILFRGLGRIEKQEYSMKPVVKMMEEVYGPGKTLDEINTTYGKWCGYWSLYLWGSRMAAAARVEE